MGIEGKQHAGVQDKVVYLDRCINANLRMEKVNRKAPLVIYKIDPSFKGDAICIAISTKKMLFSTV